ncbi:hypothetical protein [Halomicrobium urmianum]|uniref:hypothetical protein n=1 Tax=Halomicrobium urmianum TaxID=1586233 RepID=UPI0035711477
MHEGDADSAAATVRRYFESLRNAEPLAPFFADDPDVVKYGLSERLVGDEVQTGLREQTETTRDWAVESRALRVTERDAHAWFSDQVFMGWTDVERRIRYEFETRWSGTLERRTGGEVDPDGEWRFVGMHVSREAERSEASERASGVLASEASQRSEDERSESSGDAASNEEAL